MSIFGAEVAATVAHGWDEHPEVRSGTQLTLGERAADRVRNAFGSWAYIGIQTVVILTWIGLNAAAYALRWDPYPFILLNLMLSTQATYAAPIILLSQKRADAISAEVAAHDLRSDLASEKLLTEIHAMLKALLPEGPKIENDPL